MYLLRYLPHLLLEPGLSSPQPPNSDPENRENQG